MQSKYAIFDRTRLRLRPLAERVHDLDAGYLLPLTDDGADFTHPDLETVADRLPRGIRARFSSYPHDGRPCHQNGRLSARH